MKLQEYRLLFSPSNSIDGLYLDTLCDIHEMFLTSDTLYGDWNILYITVTEHHIKQVEEYADDPVYRYPRAIPYLHDGSYLMIVNVEKEDDVYDNFEGLYAIVDFDHTRTYSVCHTLTLRKVDFSPFTILMREHDGTDRLCYWVEWKGICDEHVR